MSISRITGLALRSLVTATLALAVASPPAGAADEPKPTFEEQLEEVWTRDKFTGDWEGLRTLLLDRGIDAQFRLSQYGQGVASGGVDKNAEYGGTMDYRVSTDLRKLFGLWDGLSVTTHARTRFGHDISDDTAAFTLENAGMIMPLPGGYTETDVTGLLVNQTFPLWDGHQGLASLGKIDIIDAVSLFFPTVNYGQEGFWNVNSLVTALPWFGAVAGLSLYGGWPATVNEEYGMGQSAVLVTGTENVATNWGSVHDSFNEGAWIAAFHRFFWKLDDKPGYFMVFAGGSTRKQASNDPQDITFIPGQGIDDKKERPWDIAAYVYQELWQAEDDPTRKVAILIGGTGGPDNPQFGQWNFFTAVEGFGPMASRPHDRMGVSFWYTGSPKISRIWRLGWSTSAMRMASSSTTTSRSTSGST